jgi:transcription termination factor NusB
MNAPHKSLQKKSSARLAAAQAIYGGEMSGQLGSSQKLAQHVLGSWSDSKREDDSTLPTSAMPDAALLQKILDSFVAHHPAIDAAIDRLILPNWKRERMSAVLIATLRAAGAEALLDTKKPRGLVVREYTQVGASLVSEEETAYLHKALNLLLDALAAHG